jgi:hypothetical protein
MTARYCPLVADGDQAAVWLLYEHGDLRGVYASEQVARADAEALAARIMEESGEPVSGHAVEVLRAPLRSERRWPGYSVNGD